MATSINGTIYTVSSITEAIKNVIDKKKEFHEVSIQGEISNLNTHSGHMYFTLKDKNSKLSAVMFSGKNKHLTFDPKDGQEVIVEGKITVYKPTGNYQILVNKMSSTGNGKLFKEYLDLKEKLKNEGLFDENRKRAIPNFPKKIGVLTSPKGDAVSDIVKTILRRNKMAEIILFPITVQGSSAPASIIGGLKIMKQYNDIDLLILGRGGGSIEDLWAFNSEEVAREISESLWPVISAVGHESDYTISDFVADIRASTPTAAGELATPITYNDLTGQVKTLFSKMNNGKNRILKAKENQLTSFNRMLKISHPKMIVNNGEKSLQNTLNKLNNQKKQIIQKKQANVSLLNHNFKLVNLKTQIHSSQEKMQQIAKTLNITIHQRINHSQVKKHETLKKVALSHPEKKLSNEYEKLKILNDFLEVTYNHVMKEKEQNLKELGLKFDGLSPFKILSKGYAFVQKDESIINNASGLKSGDRIKISFENNYAICKVEKVEGGETDE
ncbi:Exodeoxyribonuclease VII large subunit [Bacillus sp. OK048]|nr:Exodeoxyribonuclease VII large subunit [Bacillus sp. OK048]